MCPSLALQAPRVSATVPLKPEAQAKEERPCPGARDQPSLALQASRVLSHGPYSWYRFADQPALLNADLTAEERENLQKRVELLHKKWTRDREYLPPPTVGKLADLDPALLVTPPKGLEIGYVPIVARQGAKSVRKE